MSVQQIQSHGAADDGTNLTLTDPIAAQIASKAASLVLVSQNDGGIDLADVNGAAVALSKSLRDAYLASMAPLLSALPSASRETAAVLSALMERVATLEADLFLIKSCLVTNRRFVMGESNRYVDPLMLLNGASRTDGSAASGTPILRQLNIPLGPAVLGQGWHPTETKPDGSWWRWSGPGVRATLLLPCLGPGSHRLRWTFEVPDRSQLDGLAISVNGAPITNREVSWLSERTGAVSLVAELPAEYRSSYLFLEVTLGATLSPIDLGLSDDARKLGMGVAAIHVERCGAGDEPEQARGASTGAAGNER